LLREGLILTNHKSHSSFTKLYDIIMVLFDVFKQCFCYFLVKYQPFKNRPKDKIMARKCAVSGKGPLVGNNVSHANNKTKRRFLPNLRTVRVTLEDGTTRKIKVAASTLRTMKKNG
jgi:large subunit ribosomal protein L28